MVDLLVEDQERQEQEEDQEGQEQDIIQRMPRLLDGATIAHQVWRNIDRQTEEGQDQITRH